MNKLIVLIGFTALVASAMVPPAPQNRFFLRDLMQAYQSKKPLDLANKSPQTLNDIKNWITYAQNNENALQELVREFNSTPEEIGFVLEILDAEIMQVSQKQMQQTTTIQQPARRPLPPLPAGVPAKPAARLPIKPGGRPLPIPALKPLPQPAVKPAGYNPIATFIRQLEDKKVIKEREGNYIQVKTIDQFNLGQDVGPATCPVQALRNVITLLRFVKTGLASILLSLQDAHDARTFLEEVGACGIGTQWLTAEELGRILGKMEGNVVNLRNDISTLDTIQELSLYPDKLQSLQDKFKQQNVSHGFIIGTMDVGQYTGERGHYFALVIRKIGPDYLYLIADTAPGRNHLDPNSFDFKRIRYFTDLITKGRSDIALDTEIQKLADTKYQDVVARALVRGAGFDYKSLEKNELEGFDRILNTIERNKNEWKNRTRLDDKQLANAIGIAKQKIQERLKQLQRK